VAPSDLFAIVAEGRVDGAGAALTADAPHVGRQRTMGSQQLSEACIELASRDHEAQVAEKAGDVNALLRLTRRKLGPLIAM
jgi:hypothetical protein